jgi:hypothetical protein
MLTSARRVVIDRYLRAHQRGSYASTKPSSGSKLISVAEIALPMNCLRWDAVEGAVAVTPPGVADR